MGAVYQAAALSKAFKVKPFIVRDAAVFPIQVTFGFPSLVQGMGLCWEKRSRLEPVGFFEYGSSGDLSTNLIKKAEGSLLYNRNADSKEPGICKYQLRNICLPPNFCMRQSSRTLLM